MIDCQFCGVCGGKLARRPLEGRERLICLRCQRVNYENPVPAAAAVLLDDQQRVLLVRRAAPPQVGEWCLPGGFIERDESGETGCLRELREETGLCGEAPIPLGSELSPSLQYGRLVLLGYVVPRWQGRLVPGDDASDARFFPVTDLPPIAFASHREFIERARARGVPDLGRRADPARLRGAHVLTGIGDPLELARQACRAGAGVIQYREKDGARGRMLEVARELRTITRTSGSLLVVNDWLDIALLCGADGVHLGQSDIPLSEARRLVPPGFLIGISTSSPAQARAAAAGGADYLGLGPVFATPIKEEAPVGLEVLAEVSRAVDVPVVAIGGVTADNLEQVRRAGAAAVAMVRGFADDPAGVVRRVNEVFRPAD